MKLCKGLILTAMAMALTANIPAVNASAFSVNVSDVPYSDSLKGAGNDFQTVESASDYLREAMKNRERKVTVSLPLSFLAESYFYDMVEMVIKETDNGIEGDYIRTAIRSVQCNRSVDNAKCYFFFEFEYNSTAEQEKYVTEKCTEILRSLNISELDDYGRISAIYKYIINNVDYKYTEGDNSCYTAYGALKNGYAVCQGYSQLFYRLIKDAGIPCRVILGSTTENHTWNIVKLEGLYYLCDTTYDIYCSDIKDCHYFLKGINDFDDYDRNLTHYTAEAEEGNPIIEDYFSTEFKSTYPISEYSYKIKTTAFAKGDVNGDKLVDSTDASLILEEYAKISTTGISGFSAEQKKSADINDDGSVDSSDASLVLAYYSFVSTGGTDSIEDYLRR